MPFNILIDYDNVEATDRSKGLLYLVESILGKLSSNEVDNKNVLVRLYGGWYSNSKITMRAQNLLAEIKKDFPAPIVLSDKNSTVIVNVELAMSLTVQPKIHLVNTFRRGGLPSGLKMKHPINNGCSSEMCPILYSYNFFNTGICSACNTARVEDMFYRQEQKLVDTMLTSDMIAIAQSEKRYCIVSSDDDFWPGILATLATGCEVYHVHTLNGRITPEHYSKTVSNNYHMRNL